MEQLRQKKQKQVFQAHVCMYVLEKKYLQICLLALSHMLL